MSIAPYLAQLSWGEAWTTSQPLLLLIVGMCAYSLFVFLFYDAVSKRDIFQLNLQKHSKKFSGKTSNIFNILLYILEYLVLFPLFVLSWFTIMASLLIVLSKNNDVLTILLLSMALVATVRIVSYFKEELSRDMAKLLPFALLAIFLTDVSHFSIGRALNSLLSLPSSWKYIAYYFLFVVVLEFFLRILHYTLHLFIKTEKDETSILKNG